MRNERFVDEFIDALEYEDGVALDIGANHGLYTVPLADKFKKVYAFEPHPDNVSIIRNSIISKDKDNVIIEQKVVGTENGKTNLFINAYNHGGHTIMSGLAEHGTWGHSKDNIIEVESVTLDTFCEDMKVSFIKCDIEGGEYQIFYSATKMLNENSPIIILETHQVENPEIDQINRNDLYQHFTTLGYKIYNTDGDIVSRLSYDTHYIIAKR